MKKILSLILAVAMLLSMTVFSLTSCRLFRSRNEEPEVEAPSTHSVRFETNGGSSISDQLVTEGNKIVNPGIPTKKDCKFLGWYTDDGTFEYKYDFGRNVYEDIVLYAKWEHLVTGTAAGTSNEVNAYAVLGLDVDRDAGTVSAMVSAPENCALIIRFLYEDYYFDSVRYYIDEYYLYASRVVPAGSNNVIMTLDINDAWRLPTYFVTEAILVDADGASLCSPYSDIENTARYQEFDSKTVYDFDDNAILNFDESYEDNFGVLADDVKILEVESISGTDEDNDGVDDVFVLTGCYDEIAEGDKIFIYTDERTELLRVLDFTVEGSTLTVIPASANDPVYGYTLEDMYKYMKLDINSADDGFESIAAEYHSNARSGINIYQVNTEKQYSKSINYSQSIGTDNFEGSVSLSGEVSITIVLQWDVVLFGEDYMRCDVDLEVEFTGEVSVEASVEKPSEDIYRPETLTLGKVDVPIAVTGLSAFVDLNFDIGWKLSAGLTATYTTSMNVGYHYNTNDGFQKNEYVENDWSAEFGGEVELTFGPSPSAGVRFLRGVLQADVTCFVGAVVTGEASVPLLSGGDKQHMCDLCVTGKLDLKCSVTGTLSYKITRALSSDLGSIEIVGFEKPLFNFYISLINDRNSVFGGKPKMGLGDCINYEYKVTLVAQDELGDELDTEITVYDAETSRKICSVNSGDHTYLVPGTYVAKIVVDDQTYDRAFFVNEEAKHVTVNMLDADSFINGSVYERISGAAIAGAEIIIYQDGYKITSVSSAENGSFTATLEQGTYRLEVVAEGYVPAIQYVTLSHGENKYIAPFQLAAKDEFSIMGGMYGEVKNALTGDYVSGVDVKIVSGWVDEINDDTVFVAEGETNANGKYSFAKTTVAGVDFGLDAGNYTVVISKDGFIPNSFKVIVVGGEDLEFNSTLTPLGAENVYHIVLTWGQSPSDLDSHLNATYNGYRDHIYYSDMSGYHSNLDVDDTTSYGPETITILDAAEYTGDIMYSVHNYSDRYSSSSTSLSLSGARVQVYRGGQLIETFHVPTDFVGTVWNVFYIDSNNRIHAVNSFENESDPGYVYGSTT